MFAKSLLQGVERALQNGTGMNRMHSMLAGATCALVVFSGCSSDGQLGENGIVRFSQVVHFADTEDFSARLAAKRTLLVALQKPKQALTPDEDTMADVTMEVRKDGNKVDAAWPLGFAQYAINLPDTGTYELVALKDGVAVDHVPLTVAEQKQIRFSAKHHIVTTFNDGQQSCARTETPETPLADVVLHPNQSLTVYVVPQDDKSAALLGLLPMTAIAPDAFTVDSQLVGHGAMANSLTITPVSADKLGEVQELSIREEETEQVLKLPIKTAREQAVLDCSQQG